MGEIGQITKIRQLWCPVAPQLYVIQNRKVDRSRKLPGPWTTTWSKQYLSEVHPMTCSLLWVKCLFDRFLISDFGGKWPLKWKVLKMSFQIPRRDTDRHFVTKFGENRLLQSCWKVLWITAQKKHAPWESSQPPFCPKWADRVQNSLNIVTLWHVHVYLIWSGLAALCRNYSEKIDFRSQK